MIPTRKPTQPSVISPLFSVNSKTSSSSSILHVSLVECCFGINNVVTISLPPLARGFPNNKPQVSRFLAVLTAAMSRNRCNTARGNETVRSVEDSPGPGVGVEELVGTGTGAGEREGQGASFGHRSRFALLNKQQANVKGLTPPAVLNDANGHNLSANGTVAFLASYQQG